jgi:hypothetical protein
LIRGRVNQSIGGSPTCKSKQHQLNASGRAVCVCADAILRGVDLRMSVS